jgi:hypothetical protein
MAIGSPMEAARVKAFVAGLMLIVPAAAGAQTRDSFCTGLQRLERSADEAPPFGSLRRAGYRPALMRSPCFFTARGEYICSQHLAPRELTIQSLTVRVQRCLPGARAVSGGIGYLVRRRNLVVYVRGSGTERSPVGRTVGMVIYSARAGR